LRVSTSFERLSLWVSRRKVSWEKRNVECSMLNGSAPIQHSAFNTQHSTFSFLPPPPPSKRIPHASNTARTLCCDGRRGRRQHCRDRRHHIRSRSTQRLFVFFDEAR